MFNKINFYIYLYVILKIPSKNGVFITLLTPHPFKILRPPLILLQHVRMSLMLYLYIHNCKFEEQNKRNL